jgi:hypothetical protein
MRVHDLKGVALDYWAARAAGVDTSARTEPYRPSSSWSDGGPIVAREEISIWRYPDNDSWHAGKAFDFVREEGIKAEHYYQGPTPLVAAMRCFIASRLGSEVPDESGSR